MKGHLSPQSEDRKTVLHNVKAKTMQRGVHDRRYHHAFLFSLVEALQMNG